MSEQRVPVLNAMDDPVHREMLEEIITRLRMATAPMLNNASSDEQFALIQGMLISAGAMYAGLTVGHLIALGKLQPSDKGRLTKVVTVAFRSAIRLGEHEAREAMLHQMPTEGLA